MKTGVIGADGTFLEVKRGLPFLSVSFHYDSLLSMSMMLLRTRVRPFLALVVAVTLVASPPLVHADDEPAQVVRFASTSFASVNPFVALDLVQLSYQQRLYQASSPLLQRNFFEASASLAMSSFVAPRLRVALHPISPIELGVSYGFNAVYVKTLEERRSPAEAYAVDVVGVESGDTATMQSVALDATLQGALGGWVVRSTNSATYTAADLRAGQTVYYSIIADLLLPARGWLLSDETSVAYAVTPRLRLGARGTIFATSYPPSAYAPGASPAAVSNSPTVRVGPAFLLTLRDESRGPLAHVELVGAVQWYALDRYRTGEATSGAIPFCSLALRFGGPVWSR
jgi:hypothetical protein